MSSASELDALFDVFSNQLKTHLNQIVSRNAIKGESYENFLGEVTEASVHAAHQSLF